MNLRDYFFVKCFETANYRESFNDGTNIYINSTAHFWKLENAFQQDFEGMILKQSGKGCVFLQPNRDLSSLLKTHLRLMTL